MNTKLKCLLLDDELPGLMYLKMLCEQIPELEVVKAYNNPEVFFGDLEGLDFDLCIMDIEMPGMNGLEVAAKLRGKPVIFTTAYKDYAAEAFDLNAVDYVRKPVTMERLQQAVEKATARVFKKRENRQFVQLNTDRGKTLLFFDQLVYIKASDSDSRDKLAYLQDGTNFTIKNISFSKLLDVLPRADFCRVNKKEILAVRCVQSFSFNEIITSIFQPSGKVLKLLLSEVYRQEFVAKLRL